MARVEAQRQMMAMLETMDQREATVQGDHAADVVGVRPPERARSPFHVGMTLGHGETEHARLVSVNEITVSAEHEGARIIAEARAEAQRLREEVDDYVDTALANFEQFLTRALASIERGRDKMHALREIGTFQGEENERPLPF